MEISLINNLSIMIIAIINVGAIARIIYCTIILNSNENENVMKKRIKNILIFIAIANSIFSLQAIIRSYWG